MSLKSKAASLGLAAAILAAGIAPALAITAFATTNVNVRSCGSTSCRVIDVLYRDDPVDVLFCKGTWCKVEKPGPDGWVSAAYLSPDEGDGYVPPDKGDFYRGGDFYNDEFYYNDGFYDGDVIYIEPRRHPRRLIRRGGVDFSACIGSPNASFCIYD